MEQEQVFFFVRDTMTTGPNSRGIEICSIYAGGKAFPEG